jgi:hypothetical protein
MSLRKILLIGTLFLSLFGCSNDDDNNPPAPDGNWKVVYYWDEKDETSDFSSYSFVFNSNGTVSATNGGIIVTGIWSESSTKFTLNFGADPLLSELNDDWLKIERTSSSIKLKDDNPAQDDQLYFQKF